MTMTYDPYSAPTTEVVEMELLAEPPALVKASRLIRLVAAIVDGTCMFLIGMVLGMGLFVATGFDEAIADSTWFSVVLSLTVPPLWLVLNLPFLRRRGQTLGKLLCRIRIVREDGTRGGLGQIAFKRYAPMWLIGLVPCLGPIASLVDPLMIFRESKQCLHDQIAETIVVCVQ